ncbi:MAG: methyltransferase domain-containing protein [Candidatus Thermoplasmatota archaeon]|nr:methyltransferase domain-containing protein [Candidatus Thermoplasmatota archaeon]
MDNPRELLLALSDAAAGTDNPLSWFEDLYSRANMDDSWIPWSDGNPNPLLVDWVIGQPAGKALVVGSGLGEDAAFLDKKGWQVTAFDISETAIKWSSERYSHTSVSWMVADLLNLPPELAGDFDLVLEVHILQAMPVELRKIASQKLAPLVSENGFLVCIGRYATEGDLTTGPPWPLSHSFIESVGAGLGEMSLKKIRLQSDDSSVLRYRAIWRRTKIKSD